ncbi:Rgg/GadR/MutR family transcriptional regulator [Lactobacillus sp. ESL0679]|uniref:helix-turn-helix domain-containing protein n=1 Tax=unclassified Lactobacillus TaxID=2620435 RepID=UPI0023F75B12|nr:MULTISPECIES: Rgg/GadR/MutR family transcriptional regulator [unclassified Lactobacillus]MDF7682331.1 Rgg/GadR/MutR family transcriptional regulator [Lactobacillus sp. ESL0679]WEV36887.1 Rgg/GadR/MutR family transcriptional regulator [Lactobacillus sp. ESL0677]
MTIGELLKDYRIQQKKTQKEWAGDVISSSFCAKVEKNLSRISAEDLVDLLHANKVPLINFFSKLNQGDQSLHQQEEEIDQFITEAYYQNSKEELQQIRKIVSESDLPDKEDKILAIDVYIAIGSKSIDSLDKKTIKKIKEKVFNISNFNEENLIVYCNFMSFYDLDSNLFISKKIIKQFRSTNEEKIQKVILGIIVNMLVFCIRNGQFEKTEFYINSANLITIKPEIFFYKMVISALKDIVKYHFDQNEQHLDEVKEIAKTIKIVGMESYGKELEEFTNN